MTVTTGKPNPLTAADSEAIAALKRAEEARLGAEQAKYLRDCAASSRRVTP
ncbi:hypothetical protein [Streptomyces sp. NPDC002889]|uniref:hypothetical protein n=1 Tax=Streptomyces sp. NPDC002889 TaxID=3364669 RepID=UPI0036C2E313